MSENNFIFINCFADGCYDLKYMKIAFTRQILYKKYNIPERIAF